MQSHRESDNFSTTSSSTITPSDYTAGPSTTTLVPVNSFRDSKKKSSRSKDKKDKKNRKDNEPLPRTLRPPMIFA